MTIRVCAAAAIGALLVVASPLASAADKALDKAAGTYERTGEYWQQVKIKRAKQPGQFFGSFEVATTGCQGDVSMSGSATGSNTLQFAKPSDGADDGVCKIKVTSSDEFRSIEVTNNYCALSGPSCDFSGKLKRRGRR